MAFLLQILTEQPCPKCHKLHMVVVKGEDEFGFEREYGRCRYCGATVVEGVNLFVHYAGMVAERTVEYLAAAFPIKVIK